MSTKQRKHIRKRALSFLVICALLIGILPVVPAPVNKAASSPEGTSHGLSNPRNENGTVTWDCVYFGNYWQSDTNKNGVADKDDDKEPIKWRVLSVDGDDAFLLADTNLDAQMYNNTDTEITWATCTTRSWLNGYGADANKCGVNYSDNNFLDNAFTEAEQKAIISTTVVNEDNSRHGTKGGGNTEDKIYLLSIREAMNPSYGFTSTIYSTATREAVNTAYVAAGGELGSIITMNAAGRTDFWWLRSPGDDSRSASDVCVNGYVTLDGCLNVFLYSIAVRPALHLNLATISTSSWSYAGTVTSEGGGTKKVTGLKLTAKDKAIQASWKKVSGASGYELWYSTSKKFGKKKSKTKSKTTKKAKLTIKNLKKKQVYFVKVRAYIIKNGKKVYGAWSKTVKKKVGI